MTYATVAQRVEAKRASRRKYYLKKRKLKGYPTERPYLRKERSKEYWLHAAAKSRAKTAGLVFDISVEDVIIPEECPALGIPISKTNEKNLPNSPSIDRIDNTKGYVKGNIQVISWRANKLKCDGTLEEFIGICQYLSQQGEKKT